MEPHQVYERRVLWLGGRHRHHVCLLTTDVIDNSCYWRRNHHCSIIAIAIIMKWPETSVVNQVNITNSTMSGSTNLCNYSDYEVEVPVTSLHWLRTVLINQPIN